MPKPSGRPKLQPAELKVRRTRSGSRRSQLWAEHLLPHGENTGKETRQDIDRRPQALLVLLILAALSVFGLQLVQLQVVEGERMRGIAEGNRLREEINFAPRGRILDRNGVVLADNVASFQLSVTPYRLPVDTKARQQKYNAVSALTKTSPKTLRRRAEEHGLAHPRPVLVLEDIDYQAALKLEYTLPELAGFTLDAVPRRRYKSDAALGHILGYTARVSAEDVARDSTLNPLDFIGRSGIEAVYDEVLQGTNGIVTTEVDVMGRPLRNLREQQARSGSDIRLTIDYRLQRRFAMSITKQMQAAGVDRAAGVMIDPDSGEVLAMVSLPSYDNNLFARGISRAEFAKLSNDSLQPMLNRTIAGGYPSGSIIKPLTLLGALQTGTVTENTTIVDTGALVVPSVYDPAVSYTFLGWRPGGLGVMDARRAIALSSNIYFYTVGGGHRSFKGMGIDQLAKYYQLFGLGAATGVDLPGETAGRVPTPEWKKQALGEDWFVGDTYNMAIGQGNLLVSPLQIARAHATIINGGKLLKPHLSLRAQPKTQARPEIKPEYYKVVQEGMRAVVSGGGTTSPSTFASVPVPVAGKSGTAETNPGERASHAWFSAYAPYDDPAVLSVVLLEEGEGGSQFAAPAIAETLAWYFRTLASE